jgi:hypothetical protein
MANRVWEVLTMRSIVRFGFLASLICVAPFAFAQVGAFNHSVSVGDDGGLGFAEHSNGTYRMEASGNDIWGSNDGFFFIYH